MSWDCKYRNQKDYCRKRKKGCYPGDKGCVLDPSYEFPLRDELAKKLAEQAKKERK